MPYAAEENIMGIWYGDLPAKPLHQRNVDIRTPKELDVWTTVYDIKNKLGNIKMCNFHAYLNDGRGKRNIPYITIDENCALKKTLLFRFSNAAVECLVLDEAYKQRIVLCVLQYVKLFS